jgi:hypothetical protein
VPLVNVASAIVEGVDLELHQPAPALRSHVGCFWSMTTTSASRPRTLPDACATLVVESSVGARPECCVVVPRLTPLERLPGAGRRLLGVRLRPVIAFALTGVPADTLVERRARLASLLPAEAPRLVVRLAADDRLAGRLLVWWNGERPGLIPIGDPGYVTLE